MTDNTPYGWTSLDPEKVSYEFGEARFGTGPNDIPANQTGTDGKSQESDSHMKYTDPDGEFGAAKVTGGTKQRYGGEGEEKPPEGKDPGSIGTIDTPFAHAVVEHGNQNFRDYYLVHDTKTDKFYGVIPNFDGAEEHRTVSKSTRTDALNEIYRVLSASLPADSIAQLLKRNPESLALQNTYD